MRITAPTQAPGPYTVDDIHDGDPYELSNGHLIECMSGGRDHAGVNLLGARVLGSDPDVEWAGVDAGYALSDNTLRAPDLAVDPAAAKGGPGWIRGAPPLAVEYAGVGQDYQELDKKIGELFEAGTRLVWVVRLVGPQRVEVYEPGKEKKTYTAEEKLTAPGILRNPVPVRALFEDRVGDRVALRNLLQKEGYDGLDAVREEGRQEGEAHGMARAILAVLTSRGLEVGDDAKARVESCRDTTTLDRWLARAMIAQDVGQVFE